MADVVVLLGVGECLSVAHGDLLPLRALLALNLDAMLLQVAAEVAPEVVHGLAQRLPVRVDVEARRPRQRVPEQRADHRHRVTLCDAAGERAAEFVELESLLLRYRAGPNDDFLEEA